MDILYKGRNEIRHLTKLCSVTSLSRGELNKDSWRKRKRKLRVSNLFDDVATAKPVNRPETTLAFTLVKSRESN